LTEIKEWNMQSSGNSTKIAIAVSIAVCSSSAAADDFTTALTEGKPTLDLRLRYEGVDQNNALKDANAVTLRTRLGYETGKFNGFSLFAEFEDVTAIEDDYSLPADSPKIYSVVADPDSTEVNRLSLTYSGLADTSVIYGRQRIIFDNARFVGNVGWHQNEQTFDGILFKNISLSDTTLNYAYIYNVNTILAGKTDIKGHLLNASYSGLSFGKLTGYG